MEIHQLKLYSKNLSRQLRFYRDVLGFKTRKENDQQIQLEAGATELIFEKNNRGFYYHFAFLIPNQKIEEAIAFVEDKGIALLLHEGHKIIDFGSGQAIYFYDEDGNIVEFIQRPTLNYEADALFSVEQVVKINEIGLPVEDTLSMSKRLIEQFGIRLIDPNALSPVFCWVGDHNGVIIVVKEGRHWLPTEQPGIVNDFEMKFEAGGQWYFVRFEDNEIHSEEVPPI